MTDEQPTKEQILELWEWCGFEQIDYLDTSGAVCGTHYAHPNALGGGSSALPKVDLNNLFKYAVPKLNSFEIASGHFAGQVGNYRAQVQIILPNGYSSRQSASNNDPALALFWVIWGVIHK